MPYILLYISDLCSLFVFAIHVVNQSTVLWQEMQVAKKVAEQEEEVHIPNEIVNTNILPFLTKKYQLPECYRFGCTNRACGKVSGGGGGPDRALRCGEIGCENICAWNDGNERCTAARYGTDIFCGRQQCRTLSRMNNRDAFIEERERREAAGEKF